MYDLTSSYFEGLAEGNALAKPGYSRDHRSDCKQIIWALVVTREGFPLAHFTLAGNTQDVQTVEKIVGRTTQTARQDPRAGRPLEGPPSAGRAFCPASRYPSG